MGKQKPYSYIIAAIVALLLLISYNLWEGIELKAYDLRLRSLEYLGLGQDRYTGNMVVVGMEEDSMIKEKPLIFWYPDIGLFIEKMEDYGVSVIGIDLIPVHSLGEKINSALEAVTYKSDKAHSSFLKDIGERLDNSLMGSILSASEKVIIVQAVADGSVPYYHAVMAFMENVRPASAKLTPDADHIIRRQRFSEENRMDYFAYAIYNALRGGDLQRNEITLNYSLRKSIPYYSFKDVMEGRLSRAQFAGHAVILGYITKYEDVHSTPLKERLSGSMMHAILVETMLSRTFLKDVPFGIEAVILIGLTAIGLVISTRLRPFSATLWTFIVMTGFFLVNLSLFQAGYKLALLPHILSPLLVLTFIYPYRYIVEERSRKKIYKTFSYYIDRKVIDSLIEKDPSALLKGEYKDICILFLDIRDFTRMSQQQKAENIVSLLNVYFGKITDIIQRHNGFVNKFIGDGMMAFFGTEEPVANALRASTEILKETDRMNSDGVTASHIGNWRLNIGIGIHYGRVVMGNIGSEKKMDFTIIGDPVNITSRVEGLTKKLGRRLLLSGFAYEMVKEGFDFKYIGDFNVKGVEEPLSIYTIEESGH